MPLTCYEAPQKLNAMRARRRVIRLVLLN
ncbi:hypothetical protein XAC217_840002 [Xanthomonas citri pv. citri]|nr:hypothetical protein XAC1083_770002 [Xanthomonas citri pv. citri]CEE86602.1 hypothetical protein XACLC80_960007 [Xanthomonas citri pv. citri]CEF47298.1 hypothetical protein XAC217_840002 [Xanthomonas citri pv. citri]